LRRTYIADKAVVWAMQARNKSGSRSPAFRFKPERRAFVKETAEAVAMLLD